MKSFSVIIKKKINKFNKSITVPGDKSCSIRFFFISSLAYGVSCAKGINSNSQDVLTAIKIFKQLGVKILKKKGIYYVYSNGLDSYKIKNNLKFNCQNSGTTSRLLPSVLLNYKQKFLEFLEDSDNPKWVDIARQGQIFASKKFNNDYAVDNLVSLFMELLKK